MSRRGRAVAFLAVAVACAVIAASIADGYGSSVASQYGELRPVVVSNAPLPAREPIGPRQVRELEVRRVPASFAPPDALRSAEEAVGRAPVGAIPPGSYLVSSALRVPRSRDQRDRPRLGAGRRPVQIAVTGAEALAATGGSPEGKRIDVIVTTEPGPGAKGHTYVAAEGVELLALSERGGGIAAEDTGLGAAGDWSATLALTRNQALELIEAENFARQVRVMPHLGGG